MRFDRTYHPYPRWCGVDSAGVIHTRRAGIDDQQAKASLKKDGVETPYLVEDVAALVSENGQSVLAHPDEHAACRSQRDFVPVLVDLVHDAAMRTNMGIIEDELAETASSDFNQLRTKNDRVEFIVAVMDTTRRRLVVDAGRFRSCYAGCQSIEMIKDCCADTFSNDRERIIAKCLIDVVIEDYNPAPLPDRIPVFSRETMLMEKVAAMAPAA